MSFDFILMLTFFIMALVFGNLAWVAKHAWRDRRRTELFVWIAVVSTIAFMITAWPYIPD